MTLYQLLSEKGLSANSLAEKSNISPSVALQFLSGKSNPRYKTVKKIADTLNMSVDALMDCERLITKPKHILNRRNLELAQARKQYTDKELADCANITTRTLFDLRAGKYSPSNYLLCNLALALDMNCSSLLTTDRASQHSIKLCSEKLLSEMKKADLKKSQIICKAQLGNNFFYMLTHNPNKHYRPFVIGRIAAALDVDPEMITE